MHLEYLIYSVYGRKLNAMNSKYSANLCLLQIYKEASKLQSQPILLQLQSPLTQNGILSIDTTFVSMHHTNGPIHLFFSNFLSHFGTIPLLVDYCYIDSTL